MCGLEEATVVEGLIGAARDVLEKKSKRATGGKGKRKRKGAKSDSSDDSSSEGALAQPVRKRLRGKWPPHELRVSAPAPPATLPAASTTTKKPPSMKTTAPLERPSPTFDTPAMYNGGKIYWSKPKRSWRVYKRAADKVEEQVHVRDIDSDKLVKKLWKKALAKIDDDARPR